MTNLFLSGVFEGIPLRFPLDPGSHILGRDESCDFVVPDDAISRRHAEVTVKDNQVWVNDLQSLNHTFVNGKVIKDKTALKRGDRIRFASVTLHISEPETESITPILTSDTAVGSMSTSIREIKGQAGRTRSDRIIAAMAEAGHMLNRNMNLEELFEKFFDLLEGLIHTSRIIILESDPESGGHRVLASRIHETAPEESLKISRSMLHDILEESRAFLTSDAVKDSQWDGSDSIRRLEVHAAMGIPLFDNDRVLGAVYLDSCKSTVSYDSEDLQLLTVLGNIVAVKITNLRLARKEEKLARIRAQLAAAAQIQRHLLPAELPEIEGYRAFAHLDPSEEIGGDLYDVRFCRDGRVWLVLGDVTGHGISAAVLMTHVMAVLRILEDDCCDPLEMVSRLEVFLRQHVIIGQFVTMFAGLLDLPSGRLEYVNAGHPSPTLMFRGESHSLNSTGTPVGLLQEPPPRTQEACVLEPESTLLVYSDGVSEIMRGEKQYGDEALQAYLKRVSGCEPDELVRGLVGDAMAYTTDVQVEDDLTLLAVKRV